MDKLRYALSYAQYGIAVFPCHSIDPDKECSCGKLNCSSAGKHPIPKGWQTEATIDEDQIRRMWKEHPDANIGVACGEESGLTVLDVDGDQGRETLRVLELEHGELPETPIAITGSGGNHYYFQYEPTVQNAVRFAPGLDVRTQGGLVIGVGSKTRRKYDWEAIAPISYQLQPAKMPPWLVKLIVAKPNGNGKGVRVSDKPLIEGEGRNKELYLVGRSNRSRGFSFEAHVASLEGLNAKYAQPMEPAELQAIIQHTWTQPDRGDFQQGTNGSEPIKKKTRPGKRAEMFELQKVEWLWKGYIPLGKLSDLQGDPGQGKSVVTATLAAIVSRGMDFPTGERCDQAGVVMVSGEDNPNDTIRPRLQAADADLHNVFLFTLDDDRLLSLPEDIGVIREAILDMKARLLILDPLDCFISDEIEANKNQSIRKLLAGLAKMAAETQCSTMVVRHLNKDAKTSNPMYRGGGSIGLNAASRQVLLVGPAPNDVTLHVLAPVKENLGPISPSLGYRIVGATLSERPDIDTAKVEWTGVVEYRARDLLQEPESRRKPRDGNPKVDVVAARLNEILNDGCDHQASEVQEVLRSELGEISDGTLWNARKKLGVRAHKKGYGGTWMWSLNLREDSNDFSDRESSDDGERF